MKKSILFLLSFFILAITSCDKDDDDNGTNAPTCENICNSSEGIPANNLATINENHLGSYTLTYDEIQEGGAFSGGDQAIFTLASDGSLTVEFNGECVTIDRAFIDVNTNAEVRFRDDCVFNVWFLLSDNETGTFNEFNILDNPSLNFLGQFTE